MVTTPTAPGAGSGEMCRLTICGPSSRVELAVPAHVPVADLMPTVLGHLDPALATSGLAHGGWVLQRLGEPPLDEDQGTAAAGLYDGDLLHLRPRDEQLPLVDFDDLVDGVHTGLSRREDTWRPALTKRACLAVAGLCAVLAVLVAATAASGTGVALGAGAVALALLAAARFAAAAGETGAAAAAGAAAALGAAVAGLAVPWGSQDPGAWFTGPGVLATGTALAVTAAAARVLTGVDGFTGAAVAGVLTAVGGLLSLPLGPTGGAAVLVALALLLTRAAPAAAARLAGLAVEPVPTTPGEFQQDLDPVPSTEAVDRANRADTHLTAFLGALGGVLAAALTAVAVHPAWDTAALTSAAAVALLLQARELPGTRHRLAALLPALLALSALVAVWAGHGDAVRISALACLVAAACAALAAARVLPGRRLVPRWGRLGDIAHWFCALAVVPLVLSVTGAYGAAAALFG
ncbi:type VII secretion integral membrane protein EccD [Actinokineospora sp. 24-640]